jgi:hypothetical protein
MKKLRIITDSHHLPYGREYEVDSDGYVGDLFLFNADLLVRRKVAIWIKEEPSLPKFVPFQQLRLDLEQSVSKLENLLAYKTYEN